MPIAGRGALRIAIEDFLVTFLFGNTIIGKFIDLGERIESLEGQYYGSFREAIANTPGIPQSIKNILPLASGGRHQGGIFSAMGFANQIGGAAAGTWFAPYGKLLNYNIEGTVHSQRLDAGTAIAGSFRDPSKRELYQSDLRDLGWTADRVEVVTKLMRPRLSQGELIALVLRNKITPEAFNAEMFARGYLAEDSNRMLDLTHIIPNIQDLIMMAQREAWNDQVSAQFEYDAEYPAPVEEWAKKQGLDPEWSKRYWRSHWQLPSPTMAFEMLHRLRPGKSDNPFTVDDMRTLLKTADYPRFWRDRMIEISYSPFTRVDVRRMYKLGVLTIDEVKDAYKDIGYDEKRSQALADFTLKYETSSGTSIIDEYSDLTLSLLQQGYGKGAIDEGTFRDALTKMGYVGEVIDLIIKVSQLKEVVEKVPEVKNEFLSKVKTMVLNAYASKLLNESEANTMLATVGFTGQDAVTLLKIATYDYEFSVKADQIKNVGERFMGGIIDRSGAVTELGAINLTGTEQSQILLEWDYQVAHRTKRLTEAQYRAAMNKGIIDQLGYTDALQGLGYSDKDIEILVMLYASGEAG